MIFFLQNHRKKKKGPPPLKREESLLMDQKQGTLIVIGWFCKRQTQGKARIHNPLKGVDPGWCYKETLRKIPAKQRCHSIKGRWRQLYSG